MLSISLKVEGMTERAGEGGLTCPDRIRTALGEIAGVLDVGYEKGRDRFFLTLDPRLVSVLTIITSIERLGRDSDHTYRPMVVMMVKTEIRRGSRVRKKRSRPFS